jgi:hypothetical protein
MEAENCLIKSICQSFNKSFARIFYGAIARGVPFSRRGHEEASMDDLFASLCVLLTLDLCQLAVYFEALRRLL